MAARIVFPIYEVNPALDYDVTVPFEIRFQAGSKDCTTKLSLYDVSLLVKWSVFSLGLHQLHNDTALGYPPEVEHSSVRGFTPI